METKVVPHKLNVTLGGWQKRGRGPKVVTTFYITSVQWADGPGYRIKKFSYGADASKAAGFSRIAAESIAQQLASRYTDVGIVDLTLGTTTKIDRTPEQIKLAEDIAKFNRELATEFARIWHGMR